MFSFLDPEYIPQTPKTLGDKSWKIPACCNCGEFKNDGAYYVRTAKFFCKECKVNVCFTCKNTDRHKRHKANKLRNTRRKVIFRKRFAPEENPLFIWLNQ